MAEYCSPGLQISVDGLLLICAHLPLSDLLNFRAACRYNVAVLDSNFWLTTHVITITLGYSGGLLSAFFNHILSSAGLSGADRVIGSVFGFARGVLLAALLVMALDLMGFRQAAWWDESKLIPYAAPVIDVIRNAADDGLDLLDDMDKDAASNDVNDSSGGTDANSKTQ